MRTKTEKRAARIATLLLVAFLAGLFPMYAQSATQHGILVTITAAAVGAAAGNGNTVAGYNIYRCPGTCTAPTSGLGNFVKIDTSLDLTLGYLDPSTDTGLTAGSTYTFAATVVDSAGNESNFSPLATVTVPTAGFPANPTAPSGCSAKTQ
jgi:hypothetical protein